MLYEPYLIVQLHFTINKNIFSEGELNQNSVVANFATTAADGKVYDVDYYNPDAEK